MRNTEYSVLRQVPQKLGWPCSPLWGHPNDRIRSQRGERKPLVGANLSWTLAPVWAGPERRFAALCEVRTSNSTQQYLYVSVIARLYFVEQTPSPELHSRHDQSLGKDFLVLSPLLIFFCLAHFLPCYTPGPSRTCASPTVTRDRKRGSGSTDCLNEQSASHCVTCN